MILRNSFLISDEAITQAVDHYAAGQPWNHIIRNGQTVVANSARSIIKLLIEGHDRASPPVLYTLTAPLQAIYILSVHLMVHPSSRLATSDMEVGLDSLPSKARLQLLTNTSIASLSTTLPKSYSPSMSGTHRTRRCTASCTRCRAK